MSELRTLTYVVKMDVGDGKEKTKQFRVTLKTMEQDAKKASVEVDKLAKTIGDKYGAKVTTAIDNTRTVKNEIVAATREATRSEKAFNRLASEYTNLTAKTGKSADVQEKMNALQRLGSNATLTQKKDIIRLVKAQQEQVRVTNSTQRSFRGLRGQAQNLGWQLQDVAVQAQMGTNALVILGQQGSQLASGFGATGALVGAGIAVVSALLGVAMASSKTTDELKKQKVSVDEIANSYDTATSSHRRYLESQLVELKGENTRKRNEKIVQIYEEEKALKDLTKATTWYGAASKATFDETYDQEQIIKSLKLQLASLTDESKTLADVSERLGKSLSDKKLDEIANKEASAIRSLVAAQTEQYATLNMTNAQLLEYNLRMAGADEEVIKSTLAIRKETDALIASTEAKKEAEKQAERDKKSKASKDKSDDIKAERAFTKALDGELREQQKLQQAHMNALVKYSDEGRLIKLEIQYQKEKKLLAGNKEALLNLERNYADEKIKINGSVWEQMSVSARESLENTDDMMAESLDRFVSGTADAFGSAIVNADSFGDAMQSVFKGAISSMISFFAEWAIQKTLMWAFSEAGDSAAQLSSATTLTMNAQAASVMAGLNAFQSTAAIPYVGAMLAPAAAGAAVAATQPMAAAASSFAFAGVFDKGGAIPSGQKGIVAEYGDELVGGTMVYNGSQKSLNVTGREDTAKMMGGNTNNSVTVNSSGNASPDAIARSIARALKKSNKSVDNAIFDSMNRGRNNRGKKFA
jgi:hypothetical protein